MDLNGKYHHCGSEKQYNQQYDSIYCELCNEWLERTCDDPKCEFCSQRPEKPSQCV